MEELLYEKPKIKHLQTKFHIARYELIINCESEELQFYLYLKLYAINKHSAFPDRETIYKDLGWNSDKVRYWTQQMVEKGRLKYVPGSGRKASIYDISWYDKLNERGSSGKNQTLKKHHCYSGENTTGTINNITNKSISKDIDTQPPFNFEHELTKLEDSKRRDLNIIAYLIREKKLKIINKDQLRVVIKRHLRAANQLKSFSDKQVTNVADRAERELPGVWTLETLVKLLTK